MSTILVVDDAALDRRLIGGLPEKEATRFVISDEGGFDTATVPEPGDSGVLQRDDGRGLVLRRTLMDDVLLMT